MNVVDLERYKLKQLKSHLAPLNCQFSQISTVLLFSQLNVILNLKSFLSIKTTALLQLAITHVVLRNLQINSEVKDTNRILVEIKAVIQQTFIEDWKLDLCTPLCFKTNTQTLEMDGPERTETLN